MPTRKEYRQGISPSDLRDLREIFTDKGLDFGQLAFFYNTVTDSWEVWDVNLRLGTKIAQSNEKSSEWEIV